MLIWSVLISVTSADTLSATFKHPPEEAKPWCYWYWLDGDISKEGITKDLENMAVVGIKRAMIGNVNVGKAPANPIKMLSPEWVEATHHAFKEANRVGVELVMFNGPGWSQTGGPWIKPEQSMRRVSWQEFPATGGAFSAKVRPGNIPASQDIAVLAVPRLDAVSIEGSTVISGSEAAPLSLAKSSWIWHPNENAAVEAPAATRYFRRVFEADPAKLASANVKVSADNRYVLSINGQQVLKDDNWETQETASIKKYLKAGTNTIEIAVTNVEASPAGVIAAVELKSTSGKVQLLGSDQSWLSSTDPSKGFKPAEVIGGMSIRPWSLSNSIQKKNKSGGILSFKHSAPFTARALVVHGKARGKLYALQNSQRKLVADINANGGNGKTDFLANAIETFSFKEVTAQEFELVSNAMCKVVLTSEPKVAQVIEKQMGRMHPTPSPTWESYIFPASVEPDDASTVLKQDTIINLSDQLNAAGVLNCTLPKGNWRIIYFGMITTGKRNQPAPPSATGLECDKMSKQIVRHHFDSMFGKLIENMTPAERNAFKGITIDSYEVGSQNWTDGFAAEFEKRNGYNPILLLPIFTGTVIDSAKTSDQFLWDLRRTVADMIAENYVGGLRDVAHEHDLTLWCENYGHWGFPGEFTIYGGYADQVAGEFWSNTPYGSIECRAASSVAHTYGKRHTYAEAFTSRLDFGHHPYAFKARGEERFCQGINHLVLHVYAHQPREGGMPGKNPWFGTAFHRNTPWFNESQAWGKYLQRCHTMLQWGNPANDVLVYIGDFAPQMTGPANPVPKGYQYDYVGSDAILRKLDVVDGKWVTYDENDPSRISASWPVMTIPNTLKYIRPHIQNRIDALEKKGGKIIRSVPVGATQLGTLGIAPAVRDNSCGIRWIERQLKDQHLFFLSNFQKMGAFTATLRVKGKQPELFNPVTGETKKIARYEETANGTKIEIDVKDRADSFFVLFREKAASPSVVKASAPATELDLFYNDKNELVAETGKAGTYKLTMSDGSTRSVTMSDGSGKPEKKSPEIVITKALYGAPGVPEKQVDVTEKIQALVSAGKKRITVNNELAGRDPAYLTQKRLELVYTLDGKVHKVSTPQNEAVDLPGSKTGEGRTLLELTDWKTESTDNEGFTETRVAEFSLPKKIGKDQRVVLDLGKVEIMAQVTLNGKTFDTLWMPPFTLDVTDALKAAQNKIAVRVTSTTKGKPKMGEAVQLKTRSIKTL